MRSLQLARKAGREERKRVGDAVDGLKDRTVSHLKSQHIDVVAVSTEQLDGGRAEVDVHSGVLQYDESLKTADLVETLAHELGHLVLHGRLTDASVPFDPVLASVYGDAGLAAIARYSARIREEAEANAFATAFVCPDDILFDLWLSESQGSIEKFADTMGVRPEIVRVQLANVLHDLAIGEDSKQPLRSSNVEPTPAQAEAVRCTGRPALVDAGPGTGKTATLISRIDYLLTDLAVPEQNILVVTFSNEAAQELSERVSDRFGRETANKIATSTFHGLGMEFVHLHGGLLGFDTDPLLMDEDAQSELIYEIIGSVSCPNLIVLRDPWETADKLVEHINHCKHFLIDADTVEAEIVKWSTTGATPKQVADASEFVAVYREYERLKQARQRVDFADLILLPLRLLEANSELRTAWRTKFRHVLVDEFQDTSRATSRLLHALCAEENPPWVVGDARQAIYRFLGASPDNVIDFQRDFIDAVVFPLDTNYRSADPIIGAANELATLMNPDHPPAWRRGSEVRPLGKVSVMIAEATSDDAERIGIAERVLEWIGNDQVAPGDIAVLARRHIDVRETMLALERSGIRAQAAGLLTAEGAAGDLAAVLTLADSQLAAVPRLVYALGRGFAGPATLNATITSLLKSEPVESEIAQQIEKARGAAEREKFSGDGWIALTTFLFESSSYLRQILASPDTAERAMSLIEVVSTLSLAMTYRATHRGLRPRDARIGFAARLRVRLTKTVPLPLMPKPRADCVRVMTCHASKGLEFPCVIVSSQTVPKILEKYPWLPTSLRPASNEDDDQANALLFVGVTRAKRAVVVSYPTHAGQTASARGKRVVPLLEAWCNQKSVPLLLWDRSKQDNPSILAGPMWGERPKSLIKASSLDSDACPILTYLEQYLGIQFPEEETVLYPRFFGALRHILKRIASSVNETGQQLDDGQVRELVDQEWPAERFENHPHYAMYRGIAANISLAFAREFSLVGGSVTIETEIHLSDDETKPKVALDLVAYFKQPDGGVLTVAFRPESYATKADDGVLGWSKLDDNKRISLVLAESRSTGTTLPKVFSGIDGRIYDFQWSRKKDSLGKQAGELVTRFDALARLDLSTETTRYQCDRCRARVTCPHWIGALAK